MERSRQISSRYFGLQGCYIFKNQLSEYARIKGVEIPEYETINEGPSHSPSYKSTVIVDKVRYDSLPGFPKRKAAEQSAAEIALIKLANLEDNNEIIKSLLQESALCKTLLFQYAEKMNYSQPCYVCQPKEEDMCSTCTVTVGGMQFVGASARSKRAAEISAARAALLTLQTTKSGFEADIDMDDNFQHTVIPCPKKLNQLTKAKFPVELFAALKSLIAKEGVGEADEVRVSEVPVVHAVHEPKNQLQASGSPTENSRKLGVDMKHEKNTNMEKEAKPVIPQGSASIFQDEAVSPKLSVSSQSSTIDLLALPAEKLKLSGLEPKATQITGASNVGNLDSGTKKIFVGGLPSTLTDDGLRQYFETYGRVTDVAVMYDQSTQRPRGFGFISFDTEDAVDRVLHKTFHNLNGKMVEVKRAAPKHANPRSRGQTMSCGSCQSYHGAYDGRRESNSYMQPPSAAGNYQTYGSLGYDVPPAYGYGGASNGVGYGAYDCYGGPAGAYGKPNTTNAAYACGPHWGPRSGWGTPAASAARYGGTAAGSGGCQCTLTRRSPGYCNQGYGGCNGAYGNPGSYGLVSGCGGSTPYSNTAGAGYRGSGYDANPGYPYAGWMSDPRHGAGQTNGARGTQVGYGTYGRQA